MPIPPAPGDSRRALRIGLAIGALILLSTGLILYRQRHTASPAANDAATTAPTTAPTTADDWPRYLVAGLTIASPFKIEPAKDLTEGLPVAVQEIIEDSQTADGTDPKRGIKLTILSVRYQEGMELSLDGAAREQVKGAAAAIGDLKPLYKITPAKVSGFDARWTEYRRKKGGENYHFDSVLILRGQRLWQVQALYGSKEHTPLVYEILRSATLPSADTMPEAPDKKEPAPTAADTEIEKPTVADETPGAPVTKIEKPPAETPAGTEPPAGNAAPPPAP